MSSIIPIPSTRVSDLTVNQRLVSQLESDQTDLVNLETQISSGRALNLPSDNPAAAQRALQLKQIIAQNTQYQTNVTANQAFLSTTDSTLSNIFAAINNIKGVALSVVGSTSTDAQRQAASQQVSQTIDQLMDIGNQQFDGRYLFGGSNTTSPPFTLNNGYIQYNGNENSLSSFSDLNQVFSTNVDGDAVFGTLSPGGQGSTDLNPVVTADTPLADLNGGKGITPGSISISDGAHSSTIDLSGASTVGDVARLIESNPPAGRQVTVNITSTGLNIALDSSGTGALTINEVGSGTTAADLGIRQIVSVSSQVTGSDLDPQLTLTTPLNDILGTRSGGEIDSAGADNDLQITATQPGASTNGVTVSFVNNPTIAEGQETVAYNATNKTLTFQISAGFTNANDIIRTLNNDPTAGAVFQATLVPRDTSNPLIAGDGVLQPTATGVTSGGGGQAFDTSGLQITSGNKTFNVSFLGDKTVQDVLNTINGSGAGVSATINAEGTGVDIRSQLSGANFEVGENGGTTATQLGVRTFTASTQLSDLNLGLGINPVASGTADFTINRPDGSQLSISVNGAQTVGDVLNLINNDPNNQNPANKVTASLSTTGNGIQLSTASTGPDNFQVVATNSSQVAQELGLVPSGNVASAPATVSAGVSTITGGDPNPQEVSGVFDTLVRLQQALATGDQSEIERTTSLLDQDTSRVSLAQSELGVREQGLAATQSDLQNNATTLQAQLSQNQDVDLTQAISELTSRQTAFQAALQTTAVISKLTLLNYL